MQCWVHRISRSADGLMAFADVGARAVEVARRTRVNRQSTVAERRRGGGLDMLPRVLATESRSRWLRGRPRLSLAKDQVVLAHMVVDLDRHGRHTEVA
jgi:hypothetical protein